MNDGNWFAPKRFGYGSGLPIAWQGWAVLIAYAAACILAGITLVPRHPAVAIAIIAAATIAFAVLCAQHTRGGWKWRWNGED